MQNALLAKFLVLPIFLFKEYFFLHFKNINNAIDIEKSIVFVVVVIIVVVKAISGLSFPPISMTSYLDIRIVSSGVWGQSYITFSCLNSPKLKTLLGEPL